jgi:hypothetical protein
LKSPPSFSAATALNVFGRDIVLLVSGQKSIVVAEREEGEDRKRGYIYADLSTQL